MQATDELRDACAKEISGQTSIYTPASGETVGLSLAAKARQFQLSARLLQTLDQKQPDAKSQHPRVAWIDGTLQRSWAQVKLVVKHY